MARRFLCAFALLAILVPTLAFGGAAFEVTTDTGTGADAYVINRYPDLNSGTDDYVQIKNAAAVEGTFFHDRKTYLRFDIASVPSGFSACELVLTVSDQPNGNPITGTQDFTVYGLDDDDPGEDWDETLVTWNNAPANDVSSATALLSNASVVGTFSLDAGGVVDDEVVVTDPRIETFVNEDTDSRVTFIVVRETYGTDPHGWVHTFYSREHLSGAAPKLAFASPSTSVLPTQASTGLVQLTVAGPNPLRGHTVFALSCGESTAAVLDVLDVRGRRVERLFDGDLSAGSTSVGWSATGQPAGVYFVRLRAEGIERTTRVVVIR